MSKIIDMVGKKFGRLTVQERAANSKYGQARWLCLCECGSTSVVAGTDLRAGNIVSCGCYHSEEVVKRLTKHGRCKSGGRKHPLYNTWHCMIMRCDNPNYSQYSDYGGRGITICQEWYDIDAFIEWATAKGWAPGLTIDRIDNDAGYSPDNCRFVTKAEQNRNQRDRFNKFFSKRINVAKLAREHGIGYLKLYKRLRSGWTLEDALTK